jgi:hypothetical protein
MAVVVLVIIYIRFRLYISIINGDDVVVVISRAFVSISIPPSISQPTDHAYASITSISSNLFLSPHHACTVQNQE